MNCHSGEPEVHCWGRTAGQAVPTYVPLRDESSAIPGLDENFRVFNTSAADLVASQLTHTRR